MKTTRYIPVYAWGKDPNNTGGATTGTHTYGDLNDLYYSEPDVVGYFETEVTHLTEHEFKAKYSMYCGAV